MNVETILVKRSSIKGALMSIVLIPGHRYATRGHVDLAQELVNGHALVERPVGVHVL